ncbi:MAG: serine/threonine protein kinase [Oscillospiraceae bacterium]|nr:serine/threonine protein kinase [Oscillospiraceae bacterium]
MVEIHNKKLCESCFYETENEICPRCGFSKNGSASDPLVLPVGAELNDKILIGRIMGKGGFGITYMGYDLRMEKIIAVKEYYPNGIAYRSPSGTEVLIGDPKSAEAFEKGAEKFYSEAEIVSQFNGNPNIVSVYDYFRANNTVYLIMEYLNGITLKNYIKNHGKLSDGQALFVMNKIAAALSITHSAGVLHRDISPDNIMICMDGKVKLIDFGAARQIMAESSSNLTVVMKPGYTPMEQYTKKGQQGAWTDIYALGVSIYYALTEIVIDDPYARMDDDEEFAENKHGINTSLWEILKKCTMIAASDRYSSAIELRKALSSVSAPVEPEPIVLEDNDIKIPEEEISEEDNNNENFESTTPISISPDNTTTDQTKKITSDNINTFPVTDEIIDDDDDVTEDDEDDSNESGLDLSVNVYEDKEKKKRPVNKKTLTAVICAATAVIIGIIALVIALNVNGNKGSHKRSPNAVDYLLIDKNDERWSMTKNISVFTLQEFEGDILVTLNIRTNNTVRNEDGSYHHSVSVIDNNENAVKINALNWAEDPDGYYIYDGQKQFTFILPENSIADIYQYIQFGTYNLTVTSVELRAYDSSHSDAKTIKFNGGYPGDWQLQDDAIPKSDLESFGGDVMVTLDIEPGRYNDDEEWMWHINTWYINADKTDGNWTQVYIAAFNQPSPGADRMYPVYNGQDQFVFVISGEDIEALPEDGLKFQVHNVVVRSAMLEAYNSDTASSSASAEAVTVTEADTSVTTTSAATTTAADNGPIDHLFLGEPVKRIRADTLRRFNGDILFTLDIAPIATDHGIGIYDDDRDINKIKFYAYNSEYNGENATWYISDDQKQFTFLLPESSISDISEYIVFRCVGTQINSVDMIAYDSSHPDSKTIQFDGKYPGDWALVNGSIPRNDLESFDGDVLVTLGIETGIYGNDEEWKWHIEAMKTLDEWERVYIDVFNHIRHPEYMYTVYDKQEQFVFVISKEEINALPEDGLKFQVHNVVVKSAILEAYNSNSGSAEKDTAAIDYLLIDNNDEAWAMSKFISTDVLREFKGDIFVTLDLSLYNTMFRDNDGLYHGSDEKYRHYVSVMDNNGNLLKINALNSTDDPEGYYVSDKQDQFTFILPESSIPDNAGFIKFGTDMLTVNSVELRTYNNRSSDRKTIRFNGDDYPGDWMLTVDSIPKKDLESFGGDVMVTLDIKTGQFDNNDTWWHINAIKYLNEWIRVNIKVFNRSPLKEEYMYPIYKGQRNFVFVISREEIEALTNEGLKFQVHNIVINSAALEAYDFAA